MSRPCNILAGSFLAAAFVVCIFLPLAGLVFPSLGPEIPIRENRNLTERPTLEWSGMSQYPDAYESYFNDAFGFRNLLIHLNNLIRLKVFNVSGSPKVLAGKNDWLYFTGDQALDDYRGVNPLSPDDLERWRITLEAKRIWLESRGVEFLLVIAPNKSTIYPEFLPAGFDNAGGETPADQLVDYLHRHTGIRVLDLRGPIRDMKPDGQLYYRNDTHWNRLGAFFASLMIVDSVDDAVPGGADLSIDDTIRKTWTRRGGDLAFMLGLQKVLSEEDLHVKWASPASEVVGEQEDSRDPFTMEIPDDDLPRAAMFRDSFATALVPFLAEGFRHIRFHWERWNTHTDIEAVLNASEPDIVIEEIVERALTKMEYVTVPDWMALGDEFPRLLVDLDLSAPGAKVFTPIKHADIQGGVSGLLVESSGNDVSFLLPEISTRGHMEFLVDLVMDSPENSSAQLFYQTGNEPFFDERKSWREKTNRGINQIRFVIDDPGFNGIVRIDPGSHPGQYLFRKIEIRTR